jgi:putative acetyltransferase
MPTPTHLMNLEIRQETPADCDAIDQVIQVAFGRTDEAGLVRNLRSDGDLLLSLVADSSSVIVGHVAFSRMFVDAGTRQIASVSLAPVAVRPDFQQMGVGAALIRDGLARLRQDESIAIVLGHPQYYPRFGFSSDAAKPIINPFNAGAAWMALELRDGSLSGIQGIAKYPQAFGLPFEWTWVHART